MESGTQEQSEAVVVETNLPIYPVRRGKVRDVYDLGDEIVLVATDRISAYDVVLPTPIPGKGVMLTQISAFWFDFFANDIEHHLIDVVEERVPSGWEANLSELRGRAMRCLKAAVVPIECVVRGYLAGSGWKDYQKTGTVCGVRLPPGLQQCERLAEPIFTPATKAASGHDLNIAEAEAARLVGSDVLDRARFLTLRLYGEGAAHAESRGIIVADTKFEFGLLPDDGRPAAERLIVIDEMLTPDSSRFWPRDGYRPGGPQPSFDKQFVRDYLERIRWNKQPPVPPLPDEVVARTREKYLEAFRRLTGQELR
jgi:phosphoribosylaminoimidazole-succinocarboxamide synthase